MDENHRSVGCLNIETFLITLPASLDCISLTEGALVFSCYRMCEVGKEEACWLWDAGEKLLWDNDITIDLWE